MRYTDVKLSVSGKKPYDLFWFFECKSNHKVFSAVLKLAV